MSRAMLVKLVAAAAIGLEAWLLPGGIAAPAIALTLLATIAFLAWVIVSPSAQFFVRSVCALPAPGGGVREDRIAFTFDDGPDPETTPRVLDLLAAHDARATFFLVGARAKAHPEIVQRIVAEGHAIGSHSHDHAHTFHLRAPKSVRAEIARGIDAIAAITGDRPRLFRPPQGLRTPLLATALDGMRDLVCVTWTERGLDTFGRPARKIVQRLAPAVRPAAILTLHDGGGLGGTRDRSPTVEALGDLLDLAAARNLRCVSLACLGAERASER